MVRAFLLAENAVTVHEVKDLMVELYFVCCFAGMFLLWFPPMYLSVPKAVASARNCKNCNG